MIEFHTERSRSAEKGERVMSYEFRVLSLELGLNVTLSAVKVPVPYQQCGIGCKNL